MSRPSPPTAVSFLRKYEIGVLRAMGMKKKKVALGLWSEMLIITAICLIIGFGVGSLAAQPVCDTLLSGQIESAKAAAQQSGMQFGIALGGPMKNELVPLEQVDISVGMDTIIEIAVIALLLASLASIAAISKVTKYEPIKILMERN
jgi:putative ABC transport system permease protein